MSIHNTSAGTSVECPLCSSPAHWVTKDCPEQEKGFHHWCDTCQHGWYIADLKNITTHSLIYVATRGELGKSPEGIRKIIIAKDAISD